MADRGWTWFLGALAGASIVGMSAALGPAIGLAVTAVAVGALASSVAWPRPMLVLLVASVYATFVTIGGVPVGRVVAPIALVACLAALAVRGARPVARATPVPWAVGLFGALAVASLAWSADPGATLERLGSLALAISYLMAFALLVRTQRHLLDVLVTVTVSATVLGVVWIWSLVQGISRFDEVAGDPNFFAMQQAMALPLTIVLASRVRDRLTRLAVYVTMAVIAASILASLSRGGAFGLLLLLVALVFIRARTLFGTPERKWTVLLGAAVVLAAAVPLVAEPFLARFADPASSDVTSVVHDPRVGLARAAVHAWADAPLTGIGFGAFQTTSYGWLRTTPSVDLGGYPTQSLLEGREVHDAYLEALAELGPLGVAAFVLVLLSGVLTCRRVWQRADDPFVRAVAVALALGIVTFGVASATLSTATTRSLWMWLGLAVALARAVDPTDLLGPRDLSGTAPARAR